MRPRIVHVPVPHWPTVEKGCLGVRFSPRMRCSFMDRERVAGFEGGSLVHEAPHSIPSVSTGPSHVRKHLYRPTAFVHQQPPITRKSVNRTHSCTNHDDPNRGIRTTNSKFRAIGTDQARWCANDVGNARSVMAVMPTPRPQLQPQLRSRPRHRARLATKRGRQAKPWYGRGCMDSKCTYGTVRYQKGRWGIYPTALAGSAVLLALRLGARWAVNR